MRPTRYVLFGIALCLVGLSALAQDSFDTDGDGLDDNSDNCTLTANPAQLDADADFIGNMCDPDFNNDLIVNAVDLSFHKGVFFTANPVADLNSDGVVNFIDLEIFKSHWLSSPGPTAMDPDQPPCTCEFSSECGSGQFCNYGPGSFTTEDICQWREPGPNGVPGAGCSMEVDRTNGEWVPGLCHGICTN